MEFRLQLTDVTVECFVINYGEWGALKEVSTKGGAGDQSLNFLINVDEGLEIGYLMKH